MVMYASKHPRLSDGFHDKNEAHAYEMDKYPHKTRENAGSDSRDRKNRDRSVRESPRGVHSDSPRNNSERYSSKQRSKASSGSRHGNNQVMYKPNSHASTPDPERKLKELFARVNEWTMHTSSSGKKYYYNCKTEVSQWEKPKEWIEKETLEKAIGGKLPASSSHTNVKTTPSKDRGNDKHSSKSRSSQQQQQSQPYRTQDRTTTSTSSSTPNQSDSRRQSSSHSQRRYSNSHGKVNHTSQSENSRSHPSKGSVRQSDHSKNSVYEEDIRKESASSRLNDNDTPYNAHQLSPSLNRRLYEGNGTDPGQQDSLGILPLANSLATDMYGRLKNLVSSGNSVRRRDRNESPKINNSPSPHIATVSPLPTTSPKTTIRTPLQNQQKRWRRSTSRSPISQPHEDNREELQPKFSNPSPMSVASVSDLSSPAQSYPSPVNSMSTPLSNLSSSQHVENQTNEKMDGNESKEVEPPDKIIINETKEEDEKEDISPKHDAVETIRKRSSDSMNSAVTAEELVVPPPIAKPTEEELHFNNIIFSTETHSNYYSEDLVKHKMNSPVEQLEKQAHLVQRDYYRLGFENYSQVMMDLKFARSLVRTTEIQANVQASRIVFLRQQVKELEKLKNENAYMT